MKENNPNKSKNGTPPRKYIGVRNYNPILQYDLNGNFLKEWGSPEEASKNIKIHASNICRALYNETKKAFNCLWFYKNSFNDEQLEKKLKRLQEKRKHTKESSYKKSKALSKAINCYDMYRNFVKEYSSIKKAADELNIEKSNISRACNNIYKSAGGYIWKFKEN